MDKQFYEVTVTGTYRFYVEASSFDEAEELADNAMGDETISREIEGSTLGAVRFSPEPLDGVNEDFEYIIYLDEETNKVSVR